MKHAIIIAALLASVPAMAQSALHGDQDANEYARKWYAEQAMPRRGDGAKIPDRWWTDQDQDELRCDRVKVGPDYERSKALCLAIVRRAR